MTRTTLRFSQSSAHATLQAGVINLEPKDKILAKDASEQERDTSSYAIDLPDTSVSSCHRVGQQGR